MSKPMAPLRQISETKTLTAEGALNRKPRNQVINANIQPHSSHIAAKSEHYHAKILGGRQSAARITDQLNPDRSLSAEHSNPVGARGAVGPGLAN